MYLGWKRFLLMPWQWSVCSNVEKKKKVAFRDFRHHNVSKSFSRDFLTISQEKRKVWIFLQFKVQKLEDLKAAKSKCATGRRLWRILKTIKWSSSELWPNLTFSVTHLHCPITTYWFVPPSCCFVYPTRTWPNSLSGRLYSAHSDHLESGSFLLSGPVLNVGWLFSKVKPRLLW